MKSTRTKKTVALVGAIAAAATIAFAAVAIASPPTGPPTSVTIGAGVLTSTSGMGLNIRPGTNTVVAEFTFGANTSTGWHSHPGKTLVTVQQGTFTVYHD